MATIASHSAIGQFVPDFSSQFLSDLQGLLEKAGRFTGATSAAIAFVEGEELVTKVSMGDCAPDPGSRSPISGSFTGLCVESREVQRCDDAAHDSRVDSAACEALGISSMVIVPIAEKRTVHGVLAAFSPKANAFSPTHVALLRTISDIIIELRKRYPADMPPAPKDEAVVAKSETTVEAPAPSVPAEPKSSISTVLPSFASAPASAPVEKPEPAEMTAAAERHVSMAAIPLTPEAPKPEVKKPEPPKVEAPRIQEVKPEIEAKPVEKKPLGPVLVKTETKVESKPQPKIDTTVNLWKREPLVLKNEEPVSEYARLITEEPVKKTADLVSTADDIGPVSLDATEKTAPSFGDYSYDAATALDKHRRAESSTRKMMIAAAVLVTAIVGGGWFLKMRTAVAETPAVEAAAPTQTAVVTPAPVIPAETTPAPVSSGPAIATVVKKTGLTLPGAKGEAVASDTFTKTDEPLVVSGKSVPRRNSQGEDVEAPRVAAADTSNVNNLMSMVKTAQPEAAFKASSIKAPELVKAVSPQFPMFARQMHIQSDRVILNGTVEKDGSVSNVKVVRGKQVFVEPALAAVRQWKYKPAQLNGEPTQSTIEIVVNFVDHN